MPPEIRDGLQSDLCLVENATRTGIHPSVARAADRTWSRWTTFCLSLDQDPLLQDIQEPIVLLQIFAQRVRDGRATARGKPVRASTVGDTIRHIGQTFTMLGAPDPRLDSHGHLDTRLRRQLRGYLKQDPPPTRVRPIPIQIIHHAVDTAFNNPQSSPHRLATVDMLIVGFFFLMRPGEHCNSGSGAHPFTAKDVIMYQGLTPIDLLQATPEELQAATFVTLTFTTQKNGVAGERIGHGRSHHSRCCPVAAIARRILHFREHGIPLEQPLHCHFVQGTAHMVTSQDITQVVRAAASAIGGPLGILPSQIDARSLRASGAMALLCARVDRDWVQLIGRWRSDAMLRYLHVQAAPIMENFASKMLAGGQYSFIPTDSSHPSEPT